MCQRSRKGLSGLVVSACWIALALPHCAKADLRAATYKGAKLCVTCHKMQNKTKAIVASYLKTPHAHAMQEAAAEGANVADWTNPPFPKEKVAYVLATGRTMQSYLGADFKVLSHRWLTQEKKWEAEPDAGADSTTECLGCHTTGYDPQTKQFLEMSVGCERCHGPGSEHTSAPTKITDEELAQRIVRPKKLEPVREAMICGQCHSDGRDKSGAYRFPAGYRPGDNLEDFFVDKKPTEAGRNRQYSHLLQSPKHYNAGVICLTCHEPHGNTDQPHQLRKPVNDLCRDCHQAGKNTVPAQRCEQGLTGTATCATCHMPQSRHLFDVKPPV